MVSCQSVSDSSHITEEDVVKVFQDSGIVLVEADFSRGNTFGSELRNVTPGTYLLNEKPFFIYEFENEKDIEKGIREFAKEWVMGTGTLSYFCLISPLSQLC